MRLMRDACVTEGSTGAEMYDTIAMIGSECGIGSGGDNSRRVAHFDMITSMRLMRDACVTEGNTGAERNHTTTMIGSGCGRGGGGDNMSSRYPPRHDHQHAPDKGRMRDWRHYWCREKSHHCHERE